jgi:hypothetical protein
MGNVPSSLSLSLSLSLPCHVQAVVDWWVPWSHYWLYDWRGDEWLDWIRLLLQHCDAARGTEKLKKVGLRKCSAVDQDVADLVQEKKFLPPMQLIFFSDTEVFLRSLVGDKGLNHKKGKILGYYADKDRYAVQVEAREKFALIKPDNGMPVRMVDATPDEVLELAKELTLAGR